MTPREERAQARRQWTARLVSGADPGEEARRTISPEDAWLEVGRLTRSLWLLTGGSEQRTPRTEWPARLFQRGEVRDNDGESR